ncbi:hypothetical protein AA313_de0210155 [Arthrobotrys entomopaga]|nr:hypothetical protein AA313_de0210155 [Arthrobotrys entomopaga]
MSTSDAADRHYESSISFATIARLQDLAITSFQQPAHINTNYPVTETHLDTAAAAEVGHHESVGKDIQTLDELIKKQEDAIRELKSELEMLHNRKDVTPQKIEVAKVNGLKNGSEKYFVELPWLPEEESGVNTLLAVRGVLEVIEESRKRRSDTEKRVEEMKKVVRREQGWVATAQEVQEELKKKIGELEKLDRVNENDAKRDKRRIAEYEQSRKEMEKTGDILMRELGKFIKSRLGVMIAVEEAGGPVVGSELDVEKLKQYLEVEAGSTGRRNKAAKARERGQKRLDEIWGGGDEDGGSLDPERRAGEELLELVEAMMNTMLEDDPHSYTKLTRESAASRFLVRSFVATLHPKDAMRIRLLDFAGKIDGGR